MKQLIDLQVQTHYSDGMLSPRQVVRLAKRYGITTLAITDHVTTKGIPEAVDEGKNVGVRIIPGIELYARFRGREIHLLGYNIKPSSRPLQHFCEDLQQRHRRWLNRVTEKLQNAGFRIDRAALARSPSQLLGFRELIDILARAPANRRRFQRDLGSAWPDFFAVINHYFVRGRRAFEPLPEKAVSALRALRLLRRAGGTTVLAHPGQQLSFKEDGHVRALKRLGLQGLEAITPHHTWHQIVHYQWLARHLGLFVTAGSDFHEVLGADHVTRTRWDYFRPLVPSLPWRR